MAQKQNRKGGGTKSSREKPKRGNRRVGHHVCGFVGGKISIFSAMDRNWRLLSDLNFTALALLSLEKENGPQAQMMDKRLLRQFHMAPGHHSNRPTKHEDQKLSRGNRTKETAPPKLEDKANGIDALHPSIKRYQPKQGGIPLPRSR